MSSELQDLRQRLESVAQTDTIVGDDDNLRARWFATMGEAGLKEPEYSREDRIALLNRLLPGLKLTTTNDLPATAALAILSWLKPSGAIYPDPQRVGVLQGLISGSVEPSDAQQALFEEKSGAWQPPTGQPQDARFEGAEEPDAALMALMAEGTIQRGAEGIARPEPPPRVSEWEEPVRPFPDRDDSGYASEMVAVADADSDFAQAKSFHKLTTEGAKLLHVHPFPDESWQDVIPVVDKLYGGTTMTFQSPPYEVPEGAYEIRTIMGKTWAAVVERMTTVLEPAAYKQVVGVAGGTLTDIKPAYLTEVLTNLFGPPGFGWWLNPGPLDIEEVVQTKRDGTTYTVWVAALDCAEFCYRLIVNRVEIVATIPVSGGSDNSEREYSVKGAYTNAIGTAASKMLWQVAVYKGQMDAPKQTSGGARKAQGPKLEKGWLPELESEMLPHTPENTTQIVGVKMPFGKYGPSGTDGHHDFRWLRENDPGYVHWLSENAGGKDIRLAAMYVVKYGLPPKDSA